MSRARTYREDTLKAIERFYEALDAVIAKKMIRGKQTYCNLYGIDKRNLYAQKKKASAGYFEIAWITPLIKDFGVSSLWLLTGIGEMFAPKTNTL